MALSGLDIYKLLPKTNCRECGFVTCLAFAMQLAKKAVAIDKCPHLSQEAKNTLESASQPAIKLVSIGEGEDKLEVGNESVLFRHEEKFHRPTGIGFILDDTLPEKEIKERLGRIRSLEFERIGQQLKVNLIAVRQKGNKDKFISALKCVMENTRLNLVLISDEPETLAGALKISAGRRPLVYRARKSNLEEFAKLAAQFKVPLVVSAPRLEELAELAAGLSKQGVSEILLEPESKSVSQRLWDFTQIRRQALKKSNRALGYPLLAVVESADPFQEAMEAATYICKYAAVVLMQGIEAWEALALLTLRQNIYTDPQKPLQIEPKLYPVGAVSDKSPVLVTTNFSLTYYTVAGEVEASKVPSYIMSVDTEGMSVLTAWAAEKFTPEKISDSLSKFSLKETVSHKRMIIPGYVAVISGELEEQSGWEVLVGPKEASGIPSFLKNL